MTPHRTRSSAKLSREFRRNPLPAKQLIELAQKVGRSNDAVVRQRLATTYTGERIMGWLGQQRAHPSIGKL